MKRRKIKILVDLTFIRTGNHYAGVSKYAYRFLNYLLKINEIDNVTLLLNVLSAEQIRMWYPQFKSLVIGNLRYRKLKGIRTFSVTAKFRKAVRESGCDIVFCPYGSDINFVKIDVPKVTTIHDIQIQIDAKGLKKWYHKNIDDLTVKSSDRIVTISEFAKRQILETYPSAPVYNMSNCVEIKPCKQSPKFTFPYILYVGRMCKMKGVETLIKAFVRVASMKPDLKLVLIGYEQKFWLKVLEPLLKEAGISERVIVVKQCNEIDLANYYTFAKLFVFPSLREGFGFPPIEAAMYKIPVLLSKVDSLPEVSKGLLYDYDNPTNHIELAEKIAMILDNPPSKEKLNYISNIMSETYSIENMGEKILNLICKTYDETVLA